MKKAIYALVMSMLVIMTGCIQDEDVKPDGNGRTGNVSRVFVKDGKVMSGTRADGEEDMEPAMWFASVDSFDRYREDLSGMPDSIKADYAHELGVTAMSDLETKADAELDSIGEVATTETEFRTLYAKYVKKYSSTLINNYIDNTDLSLYAPVGDEEDIKYIANPKGQYVIGDKVYTVSDKMLPYSVQVLSLVEERTSSKKGKVSENSYSWKPVSGKKIKLSIERKKNKVTVYMSAHKKMWYGWKSDPKRWMAFMPVLSNFKKAINHDPYNTIYSYRYYKSIKEYIGEGILGQPPLAHDPYVEGTVYVWSDYEMEHDSKGNVVRLMPDGHPLANLDKAKQVKVCLAGEY